MEVHFTNVFVLVSFCCPFACFVFINFAILVNFGFALSLCKRTFFECFCFFLFFSGLLFFHNFHRLLQCCALVIRMCTICITRISDQDINIPNYCISRKDSLVIGQTGIAVYIHNSIAHITHRRQRP